MNKGKRKEEKSPWGFVQEKGQTSVEYILLLAVVIALITSFAKTLQSELMGRVPCAPTDRSLGCTINRMVSSFGTSDGQFRYFNLRY